MDLPDLVGGRLPNSVAQGKNTVCKQTLQVMPYFAFSLGLSFNCLICDGGRVLQTTFCVPWAAGWQLLHRDIGSVWFLLPILT